MNLSMYKLSLSLTIFTSAFFQLEIYGQATFFLILMQGPLWSWSYGSWIYNYPCNQCHNH